MNRGLQSVVALLLLAACTRPERGATPSDSHAVAIADARSVAAAADGPSNAPPIATLAAGWMSTCAVARDGVGYCWGGTGSPREDYLSADRPLASRVPGNFEWAMLRTDHGTTCGLTRAREVYCWGDNDSGQLGIPADSNPHPEPMRVPDVPPAVAIAVGTEHACAITAADGTLLCWGGNHNGELGRGALGTVEPSGPVAPTLRARAVSIHGSTTCAVSSAGEVACWGASPPGLLGYRAELECDDAYRRDEDELENHGSEQYPCSATPRVIATSVRFTDVAVSDLRTCALDANGGTWCWGGWTRSENDEDQENTAVRRMDSLPPLLTISAGYRHMCGVARDHAAYCWGDELGGRLGHAPKIDGRRGSWTRPIRVASDSAFQAVAAGGEHSCALTTGGSVLCWGDNYDGQLGDGTSKLHEIPAPVRWPSGSSGAVERPGSH